VVHAIAGRGPSLAPRLLELLDPEVGESEAVAAGAAG
jgi:hypothetical protein